MRVPSEKFGLMSQASNDPVGQARNAAFVQGLQQLGWIIGANVHIDYRWAAEDVEHKTSPFCCRQAPQSAASRT